MGGFFVGKNMRNIEINNQHLANFKPESQGGFLLPQGQDVLINGVFGVNKEGVIPARFMSGFIATFSLAQEIERTSEESVSVRIFRPTNISKFVNNIPASIVEKQVLQGNDVLRRFAASFFPDVKFFIEEDEPLTKEAFDVLEMIAQGVKVNSSEDVQEGLRDSGKKIGGEAGEGNAFVYAAHHSFGWSDMHHEAIFRQKPIGSVLNTLPPSDKKFKNIRDIVLSIGEGEIDELKVGGQHVDLVINMCGTPHYMFLRDKSGCIREPSFNEVLSVTGLEVISDMQARFKLETDPQVRENLRKVRQDLERLMGLVSGGNQDSVRDLTFESLMKGDGLV